MKNEVITKWSGLTTRATQDNTCHHSTEEREPCPQELEDSPTLTGALLWILWRAVKKNLKHTSTCFGRWTTQHCLVPSSGYTDSSIRCYREAGSRLPRCLAPHLNHPFLPHGPFGAYLQVSGVHQPWHLISVLLSLNRARLYFWASHTAWRHRASIPGYQNIQRNQYFMELFHNDFTYIIHKYRLR